MPEDSPSERNFMLRRVIPAAALAILAACGGYVDPSKNQTENITGTIPVAGVGDPKTFNVSKSGELSIKLTSLTPTVALGTFVGFAWGQVFSGTCQPFGGYGPAAVGQTVASTSITPGTYCIIMADPFLTLKVNEDYVPT